MSHHFCSRVAWAAVCCSIVIGLPNVYGEPLPNTEKLTWEGDLASRLVDHVDQFLRRELQRSVDRREHHWQRNNTSASAYAISVRPQRAKLASSVGLRDPRIKNPTPDFLLPADLNKAGDKRELRVGHGENFDVFAIQWPAFGNVTGFGLLLEPNQTVVANVVALPDCEVLPRQLVGLAPGVPPAQQYARRLAESGCRVVVPLLINRQRGEFDWGAKPAPDITNREMLYRSAYELGRGLIGYELQKLLAVVDWLESAQAKPIGVIGWGEGGLLAFYAAALDERIDVACVSGYFDSRQNIWQEPIDRNVFGLLETFGDAEIASLIAPRKLLVEAARGPAHNFPGNGGAPARIVTPTLTDVNREVARTRDLVAEVAPNFLELTTSQDGQGPPLTDPTLNGFLKALSSHATLTRSGPVRGLRDLPDGNETHRQQMRELDDHSQQRLASSAKVRADYFKDLDTSSPDAFQRTVEAYRNHFRNEVIGHFDYPLLAPNPRSRRIYETDNWRSYEVVLDVFDNVFAYGILTIPNDIPAGQRRPVVVCQHGLEGRPQDTVGRQGANYYAGFAGELAARGYVTFAPQNLYIGRDRFRTLQRKSYAIKKTLFSTIVPQHQQIVNWLKTLPFVASDRIAFYGLSYGGKTAMRVPPLVPDYCLAICSADFNEWVDKNASTRNPRSYVWTGEYEIFEFDLGSTFNYAEMAALIAPRPFMVERGHFDGVADDWTVAWEFAKVRHLYAAQLKLPSDHCRIEWFVGPHRINGQGTYDFLDHHLK